ncbi:MAG: proton-conducting transporter membrane subunit [Myxococcota bacterium]
MSGAVVIVIGIVLMFVSGVPALVRATPGGRRLATALVALASAALATGIALALTDPSGAALTLDWSLPFGRFALAVDATSALFLLPIAVVPLLAAVYAHGYVEGAHDAGGHGHWPRTAAARIRLFYGVLAGSLALLVVARDSILFLLAWEGMALGSFFLITIDDRDPATRSAGWVYLVATHVGTLALFAMFALLAKARGDTWLEPLAPGALAPAQAGGIFALGLVGFGMKAALTPLHVWLPPAHAAAPSHVSAIMSGVVTKMGVYGLVRLAMLLPDLPIAWGTALVAVGAISAVAALAFAIGQTDLKRMLAYSTIENVGIIAIGLGVALLGRALGSGALVALGLGGALFHVLAHSLMKTLLFFGAGAILHATGTRHLEHLGGLAAGMPKTARLFAFGAVAICALPPLTGFASELLVYLGVFRGLDDGAPGFASLAAPALALTGALAVATFVRAFGVAFLGAPRSAVAAHAHESPPSMLAPMTLAGALLLALGLAPVVVTSFLDPITAAFARAPTPSLATLAPLDWISGGGLALVAAVALTFWLLRRRVARTAYRTVPTWDCGYAAPSARMQYTASSFGLTLVGVFGWLVRPTRRRPVLTSAFPGPSSLEQAVPDVVLDRLVLPAGRRAEKSFARMRVLQQGRLHVYILYMLLAVLGLYLGLGL